MAHDILAIPISTVASESTFNTSGWVLDAFRSSLTPKLVKALICDQDWIKTPNIDMSVEENIDEVESFEKGQLHMLVSLNIFYFILNLILLFIWLLYLFFFSELPPIGKAVPSTGTWWWISDLYHVSRFA